MKKETKDAEEEKEEKNGKKMNKKQLMTKEKKHREIKTKSHLILLSPGR